MHHPDTRRWRIHPWLGLIVVALVERPGLGQDACCFPGGDCTPVAGEAECSGMGGIFLAGADCANGACGPGACCFETSCSTADAFSCIAAGRDYAGAGTSCLDDPCAAGVGACCLPDDTCQDSSPESCEVAGGTWLGAGTACADGDCDPGACCAPGACTRQVRLLCEAGGGVFVAGGDCDARGCDLANECPADSLYAQRRQGPNGSTAFVSEDGANLERFDRYQGVAGTVERVRWWGLEMAFDGDVFTACAEPTPVFEITFAEDDAGEPGFAVCSHTLEVERTATGILYGEVELIEYEATLPSPCLLPTGWLSIVGLGDPDCWFLWLGSNEGDGSSRCLGCESYEELSDLSFCLGGTLGGIFGACCDLSTAACVDDVDIVECVSIDQRFVPGTACAELDPPCFFATGACCFDDGTSCDILLPADCFALGGRWIGADTDCIQCPVLGACCLADGTCIFLEEQICIDENGTWLGRSGSCEDCPQPPVCPEGSLLAQDADGPDAFEAGTSEASGGFRRFDDFSGVGGAIEAITWWGVDLDNIEGTNAFIECEEPDPTFEISLHADAGGVPGAAVCSHTLTATRTPLGINYLGTELNEYRVELPEPCVLISGWVSIVGLGDEECWFLWVSSGMGGSWCDGCPAPQSDFGLAFCLEGTVGGVVGACCNDATGACSDGVDIADCIGETLRFLPGGTCGDLEPACGVVLGACCLGTSCTVVTAEACAEAGGDWLGASTTCAQCPCLVPCPGGGVPEGEPECFDGYVDELNGGCDAKAPAFAPIALGTTVCGASGVFTVGVELVADSDWYAIEVPRAMELRWTVEAEFPVSAAIVDAAGGCPGTVLAALGATEACETLVVSAAVEAGPHWLLVRPLGTPDEATCGAAYVATVATPCPADTNADAAVDVDDLVAVILAWGTDDPAADVNADGLVDVDDLLTVILEWGPCGAAASSRGSPLPVHGAVFPKRGG